MIHWYELAQGHRSQISRDLASANEREKTVLAPTLAMISLLFGVQNATADAMLKGATKLAAGEALQCQSCGANIWLKGEGHKRTCEIFLQWRKVQDLTSPAALAGHRNFMNF